MSGQKSLVTSCSSCAATFYVTPTQLGAHDGEVRCGKCRHVFNALERLGEFVEKPAAAAEGNPNLNAIPKDSTSETIKTSLVTAAFNISNYSSTAPKILPDLASRSKLNRPHKRTIHIGNLILACLLLVAGALQTTFYLRTELAAQWPVLKPPLVQACGLLNCTIDLPKKVDLLAIDDSDLQEDAEHQGLIHLSSTVINNAAFIQAYPLLEVTLTDTYDQPILRRSFTPAEYLPAGTNINQGMAPKERISVHLNLTPSGEPVAGYRVFVTYS